MSQATIKVLFLAEGATLAHVVRPFALARELDARRFAVTFCRPPAYSWLTSGAAFPLCDLPVQPAAVFARRLRHGLPLYDYATLKAYVVADLELIDRYQPDVIVGDFRLSLSVSARLRGVPYVTICDAYWSPERPLQPPLPVLGFTPYVPLRLAERVFASVSGLALRLHARPLERLRAHYGLASFAHDLRRCYSDADLRLFANFPQLFPEVRPGADAAFIGPVTWFPDTGTAAFDAASEEPLVYVTMGSSGDSRVLAALVAVLEESRLPIVLTTAGKPLSFTPKLASTRVFAYLSGDAVCRRARLVVCNGGSPTTNQALANGVPVLGIAQNMDQFLNMQAIESYGAGLPVRADRAGRLCLRAAADRLMQQPAFADRARQLAASVPAGGGAALLAAHLLRLAGQQGHAAGQ